LNNNHGEIEMEEVTSPTRDELEDAIAKLLDVRDVLAAYARREDRNARSRLHMARSRQLAPTTHEADAPLTRSA
jgi:hypothetical protein